MQKEILQNAEKYNWWTKDKENISKTKKISYIFSSGTSKELFETFREFDKKDLEEAFELIKNDNFALKNRRKFAIKELLKIKK